jgi:predicted nucleotidyltransferase
VETTAERARLIPKVLAFVQAAQRLPGISRVALIGSLTTNKADPKDADLLITVTDDTELASLARLSRRLQGHAQNMNRGAEVFLADPNNNYLGRICHWKICAPGIRLRCDALHCGRREYLHDDLKAIQLKSSLITPPLELWPQIVARVPIPPDIEQGLIIPLKSRKP